MNQPIRRVALFCFLLIVSLLVSSNYIQVVNADSYKSRVKNARNDLDAYAFPRGRILTADGTVIAQSELSGGLNYKYQRNYPLGSVYANITGVKSLAYGATDLEGVLDKYLQGSDSSESVANFMDMISGTPKKGGDVQLTVENAVQQAAVKGLDGKKGSVVALDPTTGAILAMYSSPSFDPNGVAANDPATSKKAGDALQADPVKPNQNRATMEIYPPGSVFKLITTAAALDTGKFTENDPTGAPTDILTFKGTNSTISNENHENCNGTDLKTALAQSCNTVYGWVGDQLGATTMNEYADRFGLNNPGLKIPTSVAASTFPTPDKIGNDPVPLAQDSIGQFQTQLTVLQAAMIAGAVANGGSIMQPYLVEKETAPNGHVTYKGEDHRHEFSRAMSEQTAATMKDMMAYVVSNGTAQGVGGIDGADMGAKTGTAQRGTSQNPLAWFVSYASLNGKNVAVAVMVQNDDKSVRDDITGAGFAGPIAKSVMEAALGVGQH